VAPYTTTKCLSLYYPYIYIWLKGLKQNWYLATRLRKCQICILVKVLEKLVTSSIFDTLHFPWTLLQACISLFTLCTFFELCNNQVLHIWLCSQLCYNRVLQFFLQTWDLVFLLIGHLCFEGGYFFVILLCIVLCFLGKGHSRGAFEFVVQQFEESLMFVYLKHFAIEVSFTFLNFYCVFFALGAWRLTLDVSLMCFCLLHSRTICVFDG